MIFSKILTWFLSFFVVPTTDTTTQGDNIIQVCENSGATLFAKYALSTPWVNQTLQNVTSRYTALAPSNAAWARLPPVTQAALKDPQVLEWYMRYHIAPTVIYEEMMRTNLRIPSALKPPGKMEDLPEAVVNIRFDVYYPEGNDLAKITTASGATISIADRKASNGIVHILDKVMFPIPTGDNIDKYLMHNPNFSTLYMYLKKANLTMALKTMAAEPLTIFAPNNEAFTKIPKAVADKLKNVTFLQEVLEFHVVSGAMYSAGLHDNQRLHTLLAKHTLLVERGQGGVYVQNTHVIQFDTTVNNGVVHMLAGVMIPV